MYDVSATQSATADLNGIIEYLTRTLDNPSGVSSLLDEIEKCYDELSRSPMIYEQCRDPRLRALKYRRAIVKNYILLFKIDEPRKTVFILRYIYGARDYANLV